MDSQKTFYETIFEYYEKTLSNKIPLENLKEMSNEIAEYYYDQYNRFKNQYPKSIKRYSSFQTKDLIHPQTYEIIIKYYKQKIGNDYAKYSQLILNMNEAEFKAFEKNREDFYNMW